jgi:nitric oxide reductase NorD protein
LAAGERPARRSFAFARTIEVFRALGTGGFARIRAVRADARHDEPAMTSHPQRSWLDPYLASDPEVIGADAAAAQLGGDVHAQLLAAGDRLAQQSGAAALAFYRRAAEVFSALGPARFERWLEIGANLAAGDAVSAHAFFALESRRSVSLLRAASNAASLDDDLGVWRKLIEMVSAQSAVVRRVGPVQLRSPLERAPDEDSVALPEQIELFPTLEQNRGLYRFLALQLAARREFGTYLLRSDRKPLFERLRPGRARADEPSALEEVFLVAEGVRVQQRIASAYPGSVLETSALAQTLLAQWCAQPHPTLAGVCDTLFALALQPAQPAQLPPWLPHTTAERVLLLLSQLSRDGATVEDSLAIARRLLALFATPAFQRGLTLTDARASDERDAEFAAVNLSELASDGASIAQELDQAGDDSIAGAQPPGADARGKQERGEGATGDGSNLATTDGDDPDSSPETTDTDTNAPFVPARRAAVRGQTFLYDEWDYTIGDYRSRYCRVHELALPSDSGAFFERTRLAYATVLGQVRHQFERIRPERYRPLRGLPDGEDFDLNALTEARIEARAGRTPSTRIYTARTRQQRDVATLFLLDMSASTEQPFAEPGEPTPHRIIDTLKEALVVMSSALDELGDSYAIYGFSSRGRDQVEVYPVKDFDQTLGPEVKARIGSIEPKHGTRMGAALRHVLTKFGATQARSKHLILLSDGYPQDQEYGPDRRSHTYGIQDTAAALRELSAKGATPFCITVDRAGNDYLREMCAPTQYLIIEHLDDLPKELPKIYRRVVQS